MYLPPKYVEHIFLCSLSSFLKKYWMVTFIAFKCSDFWDATLTVFRLIFSFLKVLICSLWKEQVCIYSVILRWDNWYFYDLNGGFVFFNFVKQSCVCKHISKNINDTFWWRCSLNSKKVQKRELLLTFNNNLTVFMDYLIDV